MTRDKTKPAMPDAPDIVELASADSFPCSDPPPWTLRPKHDDPEPAPSRDAAKRG